MWHERSVNVRRLIGELSALHPQPGQGAEKQHDARQSQRAVEVAAQVLDIALQWGAESPAVSFAMNGLAVLHVAAGDHLKAAPLYRQALAINRKTFGSASPPVAVVLHNMAAMHQAAGEYVDARSLLQEALAIRREAPGKAQQDLLANANDLAAVFFKTGDYLAALPMMEEVLTIRRRSLAPRVRIVVASIDQPRGRR